MSFPLPSDALSVWALGGMIALSRYAKAGHVKDGLYTCPACDGTGKPKDIRLRSYNKCMSCSDGLIAVDVLGTYTWKRP